MVMVLNRAAGPRLFNIKGAAPGQAMQHALLPGESADLDLLSDHEKDKVLMGWAENDEVMFGADAEKYLAKRNPPEKKLAQLAKMRADLAALEAEVGEAGTPVDPSTITPPHQLGGDGGPEQTATVGGDAGGAPTPEQGEGTAEQQRIARGPGRPPKAS